MDRLIEPQTASAPALPAETSVRERWREIYEPIVVEQLEPDVRYSIVRVGNLEYAYKSHEAHVRALGQIWAAGLVPESGPTAVLGADLPDVAPRLKGVDTDLGDFRRSDIEQRQRRFS